MWDMLEVFLKHIKKYTCIRRVYGAMLLVHSGISETSKMQVLILNTHLQYGDGYTFANRYEFIFNSKTNLMFMPLRKNLEWDART